MLSGRKPGGSEMRFRPANIAVHKSITAFLRHPAQPLPLSFTPHVWRANTTVGGAARGAGYQVEISCLLRQLKYAGQMNFTSRLFKLFWKSIFTSSFGCPPPPPPSFYQFWSCRMFDPGLFDLNAGFRSRACVFTF